MDLWNPGEYYAFGLNYWPYKWYLNPLDGKRGSPQPKMDNNEHNPIHNHTSDFSESLVASTNVQNTVCFQLK